MAKKPAKTQYQLQLKTYESFITVGKWCALSLGLTMVGLYMFTVALMPIAGWLFIAAAVVLPLGKAASSLTQA